MSANPVLHGLRPMGDRTIRAKVMMALLGIVTLAWLYCCGRVLYEGLTILGIDTYGAVWGILVVNTVHLIGISHVGIAISAAVRVLELEKWRNAARMAELVTVIALPLAAVNLLMHVGRPGRFLIYPFLYGRWHSPQVWSMTVFALYFLASAVYLYLSMRRDFAAMARVAPRFRGVYRFLAWRYEDSAEARQRHERTLFWFALCLIPIMVSVHSVYGLLFGMLSARAGWYNSLQAPYFVLGAIASGFSMILLVAAVLRLVYSWRDFLTDGLFRGMGGFLAVAVLVYLYFLLSEHLTAQYLPKVADRAVSSSVLFGRFSTLFWASTALGLVLPFAFLLYQSAAGKKVRVRLIAAAALLVNAAMWIKRYLLLVSAQHVAHLPAPRPHIGYQPTGIEWMATLGSYAAGAMIFALLLRLFPLFEMTAAQDKSAKAAKPAPARTAAVTAALLAGLSMILWGVLSRDQDFAPPKWLVGLVFLVAIPVLSCVIGDRRPQEARFPGGKKGSVSAKEAQDR